MTTLREAIAQEARRRRCYIGGRFDKCEADLSCRFCGKCNLPFEETDWDHADAALADIEAAGWAVVPKEPTRAMSMAANKVEITRDTVEGYDGGLTVYATFGEFEAMWELALAAAPDPRGDEVVTND